MATLRLTKEFAFEAAHALGGYDGPCSAIHGHSYRFFVTVKGAPSTDEESPKLGMAFDFGLLKKIVTEEVIAPFDHALVLRSTADAELLAVLRAQYNNLIEVPYQPTTENLLVDFAERIRRRLPEGISLHALRLHETATSYAEWFAEDNL